MNIAKEGYIFILAGVILTIIGFIITIPLGWFFTIVTLFIIYFFRDPVRIIQYNDKNVLSPADGKIVNIDTIEETEYIRNKCTIISIFMSPLNVHINRSPLTGKIEYIKYNKGKKLPAFKPKASEVNESNLVGIFSNRNTKIMFKQIAGTVARRIVCTKKENDVVTQGGKIGMIKFSSRVDVFLPLHYEIKVKLDDKVQGGLTVLATEKIHNI